MPRVSVNGVEEDDHEEEFGRIPRRTKRIRTVGPSSVTNAVRSSSTADFSDRDSDDEDRLSYSPYNRGREEDERSRSYGNSISSGIGSDRERGGSVSFTLEEPDVFDCPICLDPLAIPVYQCENGHIACSPCCTTMRNKCGTCSLAIGFNRCRAMEKVLESVKVPCQNNQRGCNKTISYSKRHDHEKTCNYAPCSCPHPVCDYANSFKSLYTHFAKRHSRLSQKFRFGMFIPIEMSGDQMLVFLQERRDNILFILNRATEPFGSLVNVVCVAPKMSETRFFYDLTARSGSTSLNLRSYAQNIPKWPESESAKTSLVVPNDFVGRCGSLSLELIIRMDPDGSHSDRDWDN